MTSYCTETKTNKKLKQEIYNILDDIMKLKKKVATRILKDIKKNLEKMVEISLSDTFQDSLDTNTVKESLDTDTIQESLDIDKKKLDTEQESLDTNTMQESLDIDKKKLDTEQESLDTNTIQGNFDDTSFTDLGTYKNLDVIIEKNEENDKESDEESDKESDEESDYISINKIKIIIRFIGDSEIKIDDKSTVTINEYLDEGSNGVIHKALYTKEGESKNIVVKFTTDKDEVKSGEILKKISCERILNPIFHTKERNIYIIGYDYMNRETLEKYLKTNILTFKNYIYILERIFDIYSCLLKNNVTYIDLKPKNIFLDSKDGKIYNVFLGDIGEIKKWNPKKLMENGKEISNFISTYRYPLEYINIKMLMSWEFFLFSLMINPHLNKYEIMDDVFKHNSEYEITKETKIFNESSKEIIFSVETMRYFNKIIQTATQITEINFETFRDKKKIGIELNNTLFFCGKIIDIYKNDNKNLEQKINIYSDKKTLDTETEFNYKYKK